MSESKGKESEKSGSGAILRLCADVVRAAAGREDAEHPVLDYGAELARKRAIRARVELDAMRQVQSMWSRECAAAQAYVQRHKLGFRSDNVFTNIREYADRMQRERDEARAEVERLRGEVEPGEPIGEAHCPCCGAHLEVQHGDEPGSIGVVAAERDRALTARVDDLERALRQLLLSRDVAWDGGGHDWDDAVRDAQRLLMEECERGSQ